MFAKALHTGTVLVKRVQLSHAFKPSSASVKASSIITRFGSRLSTSWCYTPNCATYDLTRTETRIFPGGGGGGGGGACPPTKRGPRTTLYALICGVHAESLIK